MSPFTVPERIAQLDGECWIRYVTLEERAHLMSDDLTDTTAETPIDASVPHSARIWNYWLGGKDNYAVDRAAGDAWLSVHPEMAEIARASRAFQARAVRYLVHEQGVRQFLDVGTGLPTADNTHEVAQAAAPDARIVYVDNDPLVLAHARALLTSTPEGATRYLDKDMRDTTGILTAATEILDLTQPAALMLLGVLGHVADHDEARQLVESLMGGLAPGSFLVICDGSEGEAVSKAEQEYSDTGAVAYVNRGRDQVAAYFDGLDMIEPGLVKVGAWRPVIADAAAGHVGDDTFDRVNAFAGVGRKS